MTKTKILSIILLLAATSLAAQTYSGGNGTYSNPYLISSKADMEALANAVESGTTYDSKFFRLTQNLTGANALTTSVGSYNVNPFQGVFDGNGYEIELNNAPYGVFGSIWYATIQNLGVIGTVSAYSASNNSLYAGGICGYSYYSTIVYCYNSASVSAVSTQSESYYEFYCGGICGGANMTTISDCFNTGAISGSSYFPCCSGGIIGYSYYNSILNCYNTGDISAVSQTNYTTCTGGICGNLSDIASIKNCFSANSIIEAKLNGGSSNSGYAGRITGYISEYSEISNNYALSKTNVNGSTVSSSDPTTRNGAETDLSNFKLQSWIQSNLGWDFNTVWQMSQGSSSFQGLPVFRTNAKPVHYTINAKAGNNGSISPVGDATVPQGGTITYTFTPNQGFQIYQVLIDGGYNSTAVSSGAYTFTEVARNHTIEVVFRLNSLPTFSGGEGTSTSPYLISSQADMSALADAVEGGTNYEGKFFRLTQNLTGVNAIDRSVGVSSNSSNGFRGIFDGGGFEIELKDVEGGVFGNLYYAVVQNLGVSGRVTTPAAQTNYPYAGGVCAYSYYSKIYGCWNSSTVSTKSAAGTGDCYIGGICGQAQWSEIMYCYNTGSISSSVALTAACHEGGITGYSNNTQISNCFNFGQVSGSGSNSNFYSGGISGYSSNADISNCYNTGNISAISQGGNSTYAGGICGYSYSYSSNNLSIKNCFSANSSIEAKYYGGSQNSGQARRIGYAAYDFELSNNYALSAMTVNGSTVSSSDATDRNGAGASLANFKSQQWIQNNLGWDFDTVWQMSGNSSSFQGFPVLRSEPRTIYYTITATATNNGSISPTGSSPVGLGESKTYAITPNDGFQIYMVIIDVENNNEAVLSGVYTFTDVSSNHTIEAFFRPVSPPAFSGGEGTQSSPYLISSKTDMIALADAVEGGNPYEGMYFRLTKNLTGSDAVNTSVGNYYSSFRGIFDGRGYEIELNNAPLGVFAFIYNATIQNLGVSGTISAYSASNNSLYAGGICGYSVYSTISSCYNLASVSAISTQSGSYYVVYCGGICGQTFMTSITDCFNTGDISGYSYYVCYSGGISGYSYYNSNILNCYNTGDISAVSQTNYNTYTGGICGYGYSYSYETEQFSIKNCFSANSSIEAKLYDGSQNSSSPGRIAGYIDGNYEISNNYALSTTTVNGSTVSSSDPAARNGAETDLANFKSQPWIQNNLGWDFNEVWQMSNNESVFQGFPIFKYTITASAGNGGSISPSGTIKVNEGSSQEFTFTPDTGYEIEQVLVDGTNNASAVSTGKYTFSNITSNHTISVTFKLKQYTITASSGYNGSILPNGDVLVTHGSSQEFTFTPDTGYEIEQVLVDETNNTTAVSEGKYTFSNVTSNHTISVTFKLKQYTITASAGSDGSISPSGNISVSHGGNQSFTFTPSTDYLIDYVLVDGVGNSLAKANGNHTFSNVTSNHTIYVNFVRECLSNIVVQVWDDVLSVINNPAYNGGYTFTGYQWFKNDVVLQGQTSGNLYLANDPDRMMAYYTCRLTTSDNQTLQTCPFSLMPGAIRAYPNPTEGTVIIESSRLEEGDRIEVFSSSGMFMKQFSANARQTEINIGDLPKGMYIIKVNGKQVKIVRL